MKNKKGVSPIVATVLLVAIVIIIAILLWFWYNQFIEEQAAKAEVKLAQECTNLEIQIKEATCEDLDSDGIYRVTFDISNTGQSRVTEMVINTRSATTSVSEDIPKTIQQGSSAEFSIDIDKSVINQISEIQIIPAVSSGSVLKYCEEQSEYSSPTCPLP